MGHIPDLARVSTDSHYAAHVFHDYAQTGNLSVFDYSAFSYASKRPFESVDDAIAAVSLLDSSRFALTCLGAQFVGENLDICPLCAESLKEVQDEIDILDEWLTEDQEA